jgi:transcriptional regulator with XRE-family HTH domain
MSTLLIARARMPFFFMPPDPDVLGDHIKRARLQLGMSQTEFAQALGAKAGQAQVSKWENGKVLATPETIEAIAGLIDMTPDAFLEKIYWDMGRAGVRDLLRGAGQRMAVREAGVGRDMSPIPPEIDMAQVEEALGTHTAKMLRRQASEPEGEVVVRAFKRAVVDVEEWPTSMRNHVDLYLNHLLTSARAAD